MYEENFGLQKRPFSAPPDPNCFFAPEPIQSIVDELLLRAVTGAGIGVITAPAGTGKTLVCRRLALEFAEHFTPVFLASAAFSARRCLLQAILFELGRRYTGMDEQELRLELTVALRSLAHIGRPVVLLVDEAHLLNERLLEEIRSLASLDERSQPLVRVILAGQPGLEMRLMEPGLEAFNQRVACHVYLEPLTRYESRRYIEYRVQRAGGDAAKLFETTALDRIAQAAGGLPRCINQLCDQSLLLCYAREAASVTIELVDEALAALKQLPLRWSDVVDGSTVFDGESPHAATADVDVDVDVDPAPAPASFESGKSTPAVPAGQSFETEPATLAEPTTDIGTLQRVEPMTAIEIGGEPDVTSPLSDFDTPAVVHSLATPAIGKSRSTVRAAESPPMVRVFEEERVVDRYAALDRKSPIGRSTYEPADPLDGRWDLPAVPLQPAPAPSHTDVVTTLSGQSEPYVDAPIRPSDGDVVELEEQIGSSVLETCLEVQTALGAWHETSIATSKIQIAQASDSAFETPEYDVVEPEDAADGPHDEAARLGGVDRPAAFESTNSEPVSPEPGYQNLFSTLRRKMGRGLRQYGS
ncbi:MAG: AAA family ATPase [Planctomycetaceae bacterium]|nr:AAA family ATPase [Planctomycetaceae bacterium]